MGIKDMLKGKTAFYFFSGKGGVGKTSISAAVALILARKGSKVLIISTDPAHSLSDSLQVRVGGDIKQIEKNLYAVEIDPKKAMAEYKEKISVQVEKMESLKGLGIEDMVGMADMAAEAATVASSSGSFS